MGLSAAGPRPVEGQIGSEHPSPLERDAWPVAFRGHSSRCAIRSGAKAVGPDPGDADPGRGIFIAVFTVRDSILPTLNDMFDYVDYDALVGLRHGIASARSRQRP